MRRSQSIPLLVAGVLLLLFGPATALAQPLVATVRNSETPVYGAPHTRAPVLASADKGAVVGVLRVTDRWVKVRTEQGRVGFVPKTAVVPGRWNMEYGSRPAEPSDLFVDRAPRRTVRRGGPVRTRDATPAVRPSPARRPPRGRMPANLTASVGVAFATNTYGFDGGTGFKRSVGGGDLPYVGVDASVDWWPRANYGGRARITSAMGWTKGNIPAPVSKDVSRIPAAMDRVEADALARYRVDAAGIPLRLTGGAGIRMHQLRVDRVVSEGDPVFLVGRSYRGLAISGMVEAPIGSTDKIVHVGAEHWLMTSVSEKGGASGRPRGASALGLSAGYTFQLRDMTFDAGLRYQLFSASFSGNATRFAQPVTNAKSYDKSMLFSVSMLRRF